MKDLLYFLIIAIMFIIGVGVYYHANLYPNHGEIFGDGEIWEKWNFWKILYYPYWQLYGEINLDYLDGKVSEISNISTTSFWGYPNMLRIRVLQIIDTYTRTLQKVILWTACHAPEDDMLHWLYVNIIRYSIIHPHVKCRRNRGNINIAVGNQSSHSRIQWPILVFEDERKEMVEIGVCFPKKPCCFEQVAPKRGCLTNFWV